MLKVAADLKLFIAAGKLRIIAESIFELVDRSRFAVYGALVSFMKLSEIGDIFWLVR